MDSNPTPDPAPDTPRSDPAPEQGPAPEPPASPKPSTSDSTPLDVNQPTPIPDDNVKDETSAAHITPSPTPGEPQDQNQNQDEDKPMDSALPVERAPSSEASAEAPHSPDPSASDPAPAPAPTSPPPAVQSLVPAVPPVHTMHLPLTMVQTTAEAGQNLTARQLGQRARRARERELQAQGLYTPKRRTSSAATMSDFHPTPTQLPSQSQPQSQDVTMQSADEGGDDDGEGELESEVAGSAPSVPPHSASHLIPPIAVLAPVSTPSRASLAQRARRDRERASRLGVSPNPSPNGLPTESPPTTSSATMTVHPIPFNPTATPGQTQPPTLTRGQLAQRARRARERVERAAKSANGSVPGEQWTQSLNSTSDGSGGMSSAGEAVFAVAPPPPGFDTAQVGQTSPQSGYGVGLGAAHVPQQLNRAQLAQRARRARERQQRVATAATHASGVPLMSPPQGSNDLGPRSDSSSVPPGSPGVARHHTSSPARTSLSPMTSSVADTPAPLNIGAQFNQVFRSLTAGDNGVSRAIADSGVGVLSTSSKGRTTSPAERLTSPSVAPKVEESTKVETMEVDHEENVDQLSEEAPAPSPASTPARAPTPPMEPIQPVPTSNKPQPEVHRSAVQSVGA
ncbi:unnamed protein product [Rhizoctonia solani]|uniref:Uncharacterized protein n=1 Tax=Rhizoctonia solani TaxID=456999 RepID=A0A8H2WK53_9AGAM|nr:unnamed protein product [Rhizoctonia solani]